MRRLHPRSPRENRRLRSSPRLTTRPAASQRLADGYNYKTVGFDKLSSLFKIEGDASKGQFIV
jgi:hypothetical protein